MRVGISWLDFKLGLRMLVKHPGLTLVGGLAIAFGIGAGAASFEIVSRVARPTLPLDEGHRVVGIRTWNTADSRTERRVIHDLATWRADLRTLRDVGAFRTVERNLITGDGPVEPVQVAEMHAAGFRVARVPPLLGRVLTDADERPGAPAVVVIGHDVWRARFAGDPRIVGRTLRLGSTQATVVGVMPEGFAFPVSHALWTPLRAAALEHPRGEGPALEVFARLAPGATMEEARAEVATLGRRAAADFPATNARLRPEVMPYAESLFPFRLDMAVRAGMWSVVLVFALFLALTCANVATLVFARAATRESEMVVRTALGASRARIVGQLFAEALVLAAVGSALGLAAAEVGLRAGMEMLRREQGALPFWFGGGLSAETVAYAAALTLAGAAIVGVVPALKVTGRGVGARLRQAAVGGAGLRFGGIWTKLIVAQVAVTVALPVTAYLGRRDAVQVLSLDPGFAAERYLSLRLEMDREATDGAGDAGARRALLAKRYGEMERRLEAEPGIEGVTFAALLPRMDHPQRRVEVEGAPADAAARPCTGGAGAGQTGCVSSVAVAPDYLEVLEAPVLAGRGFAPGDVGEAGGVVVNRAFVERVLGGRNALGRRIRYVDLPGDADDGAARVQPGPWMEIVGVTKDLAMTDGTNPDESGAGVYHAAAPGDAAPAYLAVRVRGEPASYAPRIRALAAGVDPGLRLHDVLPLDEVQQNHLASIAFWFRITVAAAGVALLLSLAGIYSVMSFTVSRRTREIGIRAALGADPRRIVLAIFSRALAQVGVGVALGGALATALALMVSSGAVSAKGVLLVAAHLVVMVGVCMLACVGPSRRALRIEPTQALKSDG